MYIMVLSCEQLNLLWVLAVEDGCLLAAEDTQAEAPGTTLHT